MRAAIAEASLSLREGNHGFGAVVVKSGRIIARAHDTESTEHDCTRHAELQAISRASAKLGRDLTGCLIVSTHEPCPMCATAILWSGIREMAYGYGIAESMKQGRGRIPILCKHLWTPN